MAKPAPRPAYPADQFLAEIQARAGVPIPQDGPGRSGAYHLVVPITAKERDRLVRLARGENA